MAVTVKYRYWLGIKGKDNPEVLPFDEEGFTKEAALKARVELLKGGMDNRRIVAIITIEDEEYPALMALELCTSKDAAEYYSRCKLKRRPYGRLPCPKTTIHQDADGYEVRYKDVPIARFRKEGLTLLAPSNADLQMASISWRWNSLLLPKGTRSSFYRQSVVEVQERKSTSPLDKIYYVSRDRMSLSFSFLDREKDFLERRNRSFLGFKEVRDRNGKVLEALDSKEVSVTIREIFAAEKAEARKANGVYRQVDQVYDMEGWVVFRLRERHIWNTSKRAYEHRPPGMHFVHRCEENLTEKLAARGKRRKRCPLCKEWVPDSMKMLIDLQKVGR